MIASDIIHSFISRAPDDLMFLALIVLIRTAIGFFLGKEMEEVHKSIKFFLKHLLTLED